MVGGALVPVDAIDLRLIGVVLSRDGEVLATGAGAQVLGHPAQAVAWLANALHERGGSLCAGQIVLAGSATGAFPVSGRRDGHGRVRPAWRGQRDASPDQHPRRGSRADYSARAWQTA